LGRPLPMGNEDANDDNNDIGPWSGFTELRSPKAPATSAKGITKKAPPRLTKVVDEVLIASKDQKTQSKVTPSTDPVEFPALSCSTSAPGETGWTKLVRHTKKLNLKPQRPLATSLPTSNKPTSLNEEDVTSAFPRSWATVKDQPSSEENGTDIPINEEDVIFTSWPNVMYSIDQLSSDSFVRLSEDLQSLALEAQTVSALPKSELAGDLVNNAEDVTQTVHATAPMLLQSTAEVESRAHSSKEIHIKEVLLATGSLPDSPEVDLASPLPSAMSENFSPTNDLVKEAVMLATGPLQNTPIETYPDLNGFPKQASQNALTDKSLISMSEISVLSDKRTDAAAASSPSWQVMTGAGVTIRGPVRPISVDSDSASGYGGCENTPSMVVFHKPLDQLPSSKLAADVGDRFSSNPGSPRSGGLRRGSGTERRTVTFREETPKSCMEIPKEKTSNPTPVDTNIHLHNNLELTKSPRDLTESVLMISSGVQTSTPTEAQVPTLLRKDKDMHLLWSQSSTHTPSILPSRRVQTRALCLVPTTYGTRPKPKPSPPPPRQRLVSTSAKWRPLPDDDLRFCISTNRPTEQKTHLFPDVLKYC